MDEIEKNNGEIIIYRTEDGRTQLEVRLENENVWLSQQQMSKLFQTSRTNIVEHIKHIFEEGELEENSTCQIFRQVRIEGTRKVERSIPFYNLDMIISLGYRVKSRVATHFRRWATERLKEYLIKGFAMDDQRLKEIGGGGYWYELLNRIRDIRSSEKVLYRQVLDLYATSVDYDPKADESIRFFKIVQNKLHYAAHGHTAAEVIFERADAEKPFMGLATFPDTSTSQKYKLSNVRPCICRTIYITWTSSYRPPESKFCRTQARSLTNKPNKKLWANTENIMSKPCRL